MAEPRAVMLAVDRAGRWLLPGCPARRDGSAPQGRSPVRARPGAAERSGAALTDSGEAFDDRGLKHRAENDTRSVPIPPELVTILREHIEEFGTAADGRLFRSATGGMIYDTTHTWAAARTLALAPEQVASPLAGRPYDLRHAAVSLWLNGGVAATEVANRAGHSVEVLLRVYAKCIDGGEDAANRRIDEALAS
jgi:integrase